MTFNCPEERLRRLIALAAVVGLLFPLAGCRLTYLFQAAAGQYRLLSDAVPVEEALRGDALNPAQRERLLLVAKVKTFGEKDLGLAGTTNYETVYLRSDQPPIYTVSASPKDRLERITWWFPVVGRMPYLGFFDLEKARDEREALRKKDLDVVIGTAEAYSTLGWFRDPVTLNLIKGSTVDLVETILHEMTHVTLYKAGQGEFNEGLANLVGKEGARLFLQKNYGPSHPLTVEAENLLRDERLFSSFIQDVLERLGVLYDSPETYETKLVRRERIFAETVEAFGGLEQRFQTRRFQGFGLSSINNAYLMIIGLYHRHYPLFDTLLKQEGGSVKKMIEDLKVLAGEDGDMLEKIRRRTALS